MERLTDNTGFDPGFGPSGLGEGFDVGPLTRELTAIATQPRASSPALVGLARQWLAALIRIQHHATLAYITQHLEQELHLPAGALRSKSREQRTCFARHLAIYLCRETTGAPLQSIAEHFRRNHSTALYGLRLIQRRTKADAAFRRSIAQLAARLSDSSNRAPRRMAKQPNGYHADSIGARVTKEKERVYGKA